MTSPAADLLLKHEERIVNLEKLVEKLVIQNARLNQQIPRIVLASLNQFFLQAANVKNSPEGFDVRLFEPERDDWKHSMFVLKTGEDQLEFMSCSKDITPEYTIDFIHKGSMLWDKALTLINAQETNMAHIVLTGEDEETEE